MIEDYLEGDCRGCGAQRRAFILDPTVVNWKDMDRTIPWGGNTSKISPRFNSPFWIGGGTSVSPTRMGSQEIGSPSGTIGPVEVRNAQPFHVSVIGSSAKHRDPAPTFSKIIGREISNKSRANVYPLFRKNFTCEAVLTKSPNFMDLGISSVHASDELRSFSIPATRIGRAIDGSNWLLSGYLIGEVTADIMSRTRSEQNYSSRTDFETRRENQDIVRKNIFMSRPPLDSTPFGANTTNGTTSPIDLIPVRTKIPDPTPQTVPKYL